MNWFNNLSIKYKISLIALIGIIAVGSTFITNYRLASGAKLKLQSTTDTQLPTIQLINELQGKFAQLHNTYQSALIARDEGLLREANEASRFLILRLEQAKQNNPAFTVDLDTLISSLQLYSEAFSSYALKIIAGLDSESNEAIESYEEVMDLREGYETAQEQFINRWFSDFKSDLLSIQEAEDLIIERSTIIGISAVTLLIIFSVLIMQRITQVLNTAVRVAGRIANGELKQDIQVVSSDESGQLMNSLRAMRDSLSLQKSEVDQRDNLQKALAGLNETMRGDQNMDVLATNIIEYLAHATHSCIGMLYLLENECLHMTASFAASIPANKRSLAIGESLVGQSALERKSFLITDIPANYVQAGSGLGQAAPTSLLVFPVELDGQLLGVIELGAFHVFHEQDMEFVERGREGVAIALHSAQSRVQMANMLQQTRNQARELQDQQERMKVINAELEQRSLDLDRQKNEILQKNSELERSKKVLVEKSQALEASDRYKTQFLSTMSHELRTPLNSILILSQALIDNKRGNLSEKEVQHAQVIHSSGSDLLTLINDILDLSKIEEGKLDLVLEPADISEIASEFKKRFEFIVTNKGLDFHVTIAPDLPPTIITDTHRLNQILKNFVSNAIKFTEKGSITIEFQKPRSPFVPMQTALDPDNSFVILVRDTGIGIPKDKQDIIFEAFKQADGTTSRKYGGTGLGLTISRELAGLLGGEISVHSDGQGAGSVFYIILPFDSEAKPDATPRDEMFLPAHKPEPEPAETTSGAASSMADAEKAAILAAYQNASNAVAEVSADLGNSHFTSAMRVNRILVVEDDQKFASILDDLIREAGLECDLVHSGSDAFTYLEHYRPQAIILDLTLPDLSGWEVLKQLKASAKAKSIPVHIVSAMPEKAQALRLGAADFTEKPVSQDDVQELLSRIKEEIGNSFKHVLLVEDNSSLHDAIREQFAAKGITLDIAANGAEGLSIIEREGFDCLIVDLMLPDMDGVELLARVRQFPQYREKPIIVFTAAELSAEREFEISKYSDRVIIKSGQAMDRLVGAVSNFIGQVTQSPAHASAIATVPAPAVPTVPAPATDARARTMDYLPYQEGDLADRKVLLVDDDIRNIYSLSAILETEGIATTTAMSGLEALDKLGKSSEFDVILMDIMMPEMDGYETIRLIRQQAGLANISIIALTAKAMKEDRDLCLQAGASDYLAKPVDTDMLLRMILTWIRKQA